MVRRAWYRSRQPRARFIARWASRWCYRARAGERGAREHGAGERGASESGASELGASERGGVGRDAWERQLGELQVAIGVTTLPNAGQQVSEVWSARPERGQRAARRGRGLCALETRTSRLLLCGLPPCRGWLRLSNSCAHRPARVSAVQSHARHATLHSFYSARFGAAAGRRSRCGAAVVAPLITTRKQQRWAAWPRASGRAPYLPSKADCAVSASSPGYLESVYVRHLDRKMARAPFKPMQSGTVPSALPEQRPALARTQTFLGEVQTHQHSFKSFSQPPGMALSTMRELSVEAQEWGLRVSDPVSKLLDNVW